MGGIKNRTRPLIRRVFRWAVRSNSPAVAALALAALTRRVNERGERRILFLGSRASLDDIDALIRYSGRYQYLYLERFYFGHILKTFVTEPGLRENNYYVDKKFKPGRERTYAYIALLFPYLKRLLRIDALMTSNLGYIEQQELFHVAKNTGFPTVILLREGMVHPASADAYFTVYDNKKATCDLFLCYNEIIKKSILKRGVPGLSDSNMKVTGLPRCDFYVKENAEPAGQLVLFTFNADVKFTRILWDEERLEEARRITLQFHRNVLALAENRPDIKVVCKTKPSSHYIEEMEGIASDYFGGRPMPDNLTITQSGAAKDLILESRWVLGIGNSTTLLEALLANRSVACPDYSSVIDPGEWDFMSGAEDLIRYVTSYDDLAALVEDGDEQPAARDADSYEQVLSRYLYSTDGMASARVEEYVSTVLA